MSKNRSLIILIMMIFLLATIPTSLGATPSKDQDVKWLKLYIAQAPQIISDLNGITKAANEKDYNKLYDGGHSLLVDAGGLLKSSKGFKVSPELKKAKAEAELSFSDEMTAGKFLMTAAKKQKVGDVNGQNSALKSAVYYLNSCAKHSDNLVKYLNIYNGKSETSKSKSNTGDSKTGESKSNTVSNTPTRPNTDNAVIIANSNTKVYHAPGCRYVPEIHTEHLVTTFKSRKEAEAAGYRACKVCGG